MEKNTKSPDVECKMPLDRENRFAIKNLERQVTKLETTVNTLTALCDIYAKANGIEVEQYKGLVVISQI